MKKFILMFALMISAILGANAQTAIESTKLLDNVYIGVNGGATTNLKFDHLFPLNGTAGIRLGKDISPVFGLQVAGEAWFGDANFANSHTVVKAINTEVNGTVNLTNLFLGYGEKPRAFEVTTVTGLGYLAILNDHYLSTIGDNEELSAKTALEFDWNFGKNTEWRFYAQPGVYWNLTGKNSTDAIQFNKSKAQLAVLLGIDYRFETSNGTHNFKTWDVGALNNEINSLRAENEALKNRKPEVIKEVVEKVTTKTSQTKFVVFFEQGKSDLTADTKTILDEIPSDATVNVVGHASVDGGVEVNQTLSENRANAVADYLKAKGVNTDTVRGEGKTGTPTNRVVIITVK